MSNFCSYKAEIIDFTKFQDNKVLIFGENRDEEGLDSNGSGKSTILDAICWALSGKTSKRGKIGVNDIIGPWEENALVELTLLGQFNLHIQRVKKEKGSDLVFKVNGVDKHVEGNTEKSQHNLLYYLGVPREHYKKWFEDFMNTYYFSKEIAQVFTGVTSTRSDKFQFISRFMNLRLLDLAGENVKNKLDDAESELKVLQSNLSIIKDRIAGASSKEILKKESLQYDKAIKKYKQDLADHEAVIDKARQRSSLEYIIKNKTDMLYVKEKDLEEKLGILKNQYDIKIKEYDGLKELEEATKQLEEELSLIKPDELHKHIDDFTERLLERSGQLTGLKLKVDNSVSTIRDYRSKLTNADRCPKCKTPLMHLDGRIVDLNPKALQDEIDSMEKRILGFQKTIEKLELEEKREEEAATKVQKEIQAYESKKSMLDGRKMRLENKDKLANEINEIMAQKESFETNTNELIKALEKELKELLLQVEAMPVYKPEVEIKQEMDKINHLLDETMKSRQRNEFILEKVDEDIKEEEGLLGKILAGEEFIDQLRFIFKGYPDIRKARIDEFVPQFRVEANNFMNQLRSKIKIVIDTDRETKKGTLVDEFPIEGIDIHGKKRGLETFSDGEKSRISISIAWSLRALTRKKVYLPFQFNMLDEIADGLDETGIDFLNKIMTDDDQYLVISHFSHFKNKFSSSIKAIRENGQSTVEIIQ